MADVSNTSERDRLQAKYQRLRKGLEARADGWRKAADLQERHRGNDCATIEWCDAKRRCADEIDALLREGTSEPGGAE